MHIWIHFYHLSVTDITKITVTIAGSQCTVNSATTSTIVCITGTYSSSTGITTSITAPVLVFFTNIGSASNVSVYSCFHIKVAI